MGIASFLLNSITLHRESKTNKRKRFTSDRKFSILEVEKVIVKRLLFSISFSPC